MALVAATTLFSLNNCSKDDDPANPDNTVPDPVGTITANISKEVRIDVPSFTDSTGYHDGGYIRWDAPDNFYLYASRYYVSICDLGVMKGLGNITSIPDAGFTVPTTSTNGTVACEVGHGYVVRFHNLGSSSGQVYNDQYVRLYVVESISGGAKVKYQFPFNP
jgi:hypothetical protein